jgi:ubiquinone/menaquinone biosynthesis C-methylase UbiE
MPAAEFVHADAIPLPFSVDAFDRVFTGDFYGHLEGTEREEFLAEARRVAHELGGGTVLHASAWFVIVASPAAN